MCKSYTNIQKVDPLDKKHYRLVNISDCNGTRTHNQLVRRKTLNHLAKLDQWAELSRKYLSVRCIWLYVFIMSCMRFRVNSHSIVAWMWRNSLLEAGAIWSLSDCNWTQTQNHLVHKQTLNYLAKLAKWLSCVLSTHMYGAFDCMFLSCHIHVSEWIHVL